MEINNKHNLPKYNSYNYILEPMDVDPFDLDQRSENSTFFLLFQGYDKR